MAQNLLVAVVGYTGGVGKSLLAAMERIHLAPFALVRSTTMQFGTGTGSTCGAPVPVDMRALAEKLLAAAAEKGKVPVIADVTASADVQGKYRDWLAAGISVVAANKGIHGCLFDPRWGGVRGWLAAKL